MVSALSTSTKYLRDLAPLGILSKSLATLQRFAPMPDSPLFPWQSSEDSPKLTQEIKDPLSPARIELPRHEGLLLNEVLFAQWAAKTYSFFGEGLSSDPQVVTELIDFCHRFLCLRLQLADWVKDDLAFDDKPLTATESLSIPLPDGSSKAAPLYLLYMIYGFFV